MNPMMAARAYAAVQGVAMPTAPAAQAPGVGDGGFADLVKNAMTDMAQQSKAAETQMASSIQGQGNLIDVVTALSSAEASLETVISVRDQVISAYKEIMAMPL
ncbi:flagellar hook-basal body complex protein FliE [Brevundimonas nasdae]|jgi:flagellar hook-basal body complex protein FliE|uniref:Flagellar hook-basal body complex protein FliE n=1 Tax=Brevundimonas nasdae TaxID=172043 RepID=A0ABX8TGN4_9CAUL|nr:flagellar hook-basal body complex protein FliE [Brevundimonas nasdae]MBK6025696.1 flagellar hook-basal body complex protein FliE [Brevundimonas nasdae]MDQ0452456.1 flagellar hook-basal body complex protein FliE [Brevundimonas nasdae]QYC10391.1 flagellar hook-basal body complex protein FliE [Brevundimonas nasdae]QYC13179.1 flagellar hook-basal body complex protein FliE [Brevundimonas nasdae]